MPFFSIIIPTYNSEATISQCLKTVLSQIFTDFEVLIMDGNSNDKTLDIIQSFGNPKIKVFSERDKGVYDAMNKGIKKSLGKWIYFLGSDDTLFNDNVLQIISEEIGLDKELEFVYGNIHSKKYGEKYDGIFTPEKMITQNIAHQAIFYSNSIFKKFGVYDLQYKILADYAFNIEVFLNTKIKKKYVDVVVANYAEGGISDCIPDELFLKNHAKILIKYGYQTLPLLYLKQNSSIREFLNILLKRIYK